MPEDCAFCRLRAEEVIAKEDGCVAIWTGEPPAGSAMILPTRHVAEPWDLTADEWTATRVLLELVRDEVVTRHRPDGWNVGWNVGATGGQSVAHAHCHLVPRYADEQYAGRGLRWWFKQPSNARPG